MNKAERMAWAAAQRKARYQPPALAQPAARIGPAGGPQLEVRRTSSTRLALEHGTRRWTAAQCRMDKARLWVIDDGATTLAQLWLSLWPRPCHLNQLQEELDRILEHG